MGKQRHYSPPEWAEPDAQTSSLHFHARVAQTVMGIYTILEAQHEELQALKLAIAEMRNEKPAREKKL